MDYTRNGRGFRAESPDRFHRTVKQMQAIGETRARDRIRILRAEIRNASDQCARIHGQCVAAYFAAAYRAAFGCEVPSLTEEFRDNVAWLHSQGAPRYEAVAFARWKLTPEGRESGHGAGRIGHFFSPYSPEAIYQREITGARPVKFRPLR